MVADSVCLRVMYILTCFSIQYYGSSHVRTHTLCVHVRTRTPHSEGSLYTNMVSRTVMIISLHDAHVWTEVSIINSNSTACCSNVTDWFNAKDVFPDVLWEMHKSP